MRSVMNTAGGGLGDGVISEPHGAICEIGSSHSVINDKLKPWQRPGVSIRFLEAFARLHHITPEMTTKDVMESIIKPESAASMCCYVELLASNTRCPPPPQWLGKTTHFVSHWCVVAIDTTPCHVNMSTPRPVISIIFFIQVGLQIS